MIRYTNPARLVPGMVVRDAIRGDSTVLSVNKRTLEHKGFEGTRVRYDVKIRTAAGHTHTDLGVPPSSKYRVVVYEADDE